MKGEAAMISLFAMFIVLSAVASVFNTTDDVGIVSSGHIEQMKSSSNYIIPSSAKATYDDVIYVEGTDFRVECDKTIYTGLVELNVVCEITNLKNEIIVDKDVRMFFNSNEAKIKEVYYLDNTIKTGEKCSQLGVRTECYDAPDNKTEDTIKVCSDYGYCSKYTNVYGEWIKINDLDTSADKVNNLIFNPFETKQIKFVIKIPEFSKGKFDVVAGDTTLDPWWDTSYNYRIKITIDNSDSATALVNIPVLVHINSSRADMDKINDDGRDVMFATESATQLYHEIDYANSTDYWAWVKIPFISAGSTTEYFYAYYNNSVATYDISRIDDVWSNNYTLVMHFSDTNSSSPSWNTLYDSTGLNANSTTTGAHTILNGTVGRALWLSDATTAQYITVADDRNLDGMKSFSFIINYSTYEDGSNWQALWFKRNATGGATGGYCEFEDDSAPRLYCIGQNAGASEYAYYSTKDHYAGKNFIHWNSGDGNIVFYSNGTAVGSNVDADVSTGAVSSNLYIGSEGAGNPIRAIIDEFRWANVSRSTDWILADAYSQNDTLFSYGPESPYSIEISNFTYANFTYSSAMYEHRGSLHEMKLGSNTSVTVSGSLWWNSTKYDVMAYNSTPYNWTLNISLLPNFTATDGVAITSYWNISTVYANGTTFTNVTSSTMTQNLYWGYNLSAPTANITTGLGGDGIRISSTLTTEGVATIYNVTGVFNNTGYTPSGSYYFDTTIPMVSTATTFYYNYGMTLSYGGNRVYRNSTTSSITVSAITIETGSGADGLPALDYRYFKEASPYESINAKHNIMMTIWNTDPSVNTTFNFTLGSAANNTFFINPPYANVSAFSIEEYWNDTATDNITYPVRSYHLNGLRIKNTTVTSNNVSLYLLNSSYADVVSFRVVDEQEHLLDDVIIDAQRYYPGDNLYRTVTRGYTDTYGEDTLRLYKCTGESSVYHKFVLYRDYVAISSFDQMCLVDDTYTLVVSEDSVIDYWNMYKDITGGCTWHNSTQLLVCDFASNAGNSYPVELYVKEFTPVGWTQECNTTTTGSSGSLTCDLSGMTTEEYYFQFKIIDGNYIYVLDAGTLKNVGTGEYGQMGIFVAFLLIITLAFIGWQSPMIMMLLSIVGIAAGMFLGLYEVSIAGIMSLVIAGALIMYKV